LLARSRTRCCTPKQQVGDNDDDIQSTSRKRVLTLGPRDSGIGRSRMKIIGCDFHPSFQQIAICDLGTGEIHERKVSHSGGQAERFYRELGEPALIGIEATGSCQSFLDLVQQLGHEIWVGDAAKIRASYVRWRSTDKQDAGHISTLLLEKRSPQLWTPSAAIRDQRQLLRHRGQAGRDPDEGEEQPAASGDEPGDAEKEPAVEPSGMEQFQQVTMPGWAGVRREDLLHLLKQLNHQTDQLDQAVKRAARQTSPGPVADDSAWSRASDGAGLRAHHRGCGTLCR
jgi:transposase